MDDAEFEERHQRLLAALDQGSSLLEQHGEFQWAAWLTADRGRIKHGDRYGLDHVLAAFGGMGSLSDLTFHPINGNANNDEDGARGTERLRELTGAVYRDAEALRRSLDRP